MINFPDIPGNTEIQGSFDFEGYEQLNFFAEGHWDKSSFIEALKLDCGDDYDLDDEAIEHKYLSKVYNEEYEAEEYCFSTTQSEDSIPVTIFDIY
jgi:hypothetical protein